MTIGDIRVVWNQYRFTPGTDLAASREHSIQQLQKEVLFRNKSQTKSVGFQVQAVLIPERVLISRIRLVMPERLFISMLVLLLSVACIHSGRIITVPDLTEYKRAEFGAWQDSDGDCQNTRHEVLIRDSLLPVTFYTPRQCMVKTGKWISPYTAQLHFESRHLDIDHVVPLKEAWISGASAWSQERRRQFANDMRPGHLLVVERGLNRSKSDQDPAAWLPPIGQCEYIQNWTAVKRRYELAMDAAEARVVADYSAKCALE
ncbi:MAG: HNH endonuclease [Leptospiraceae bacterium]|nr:HNH endonuclease [Leptospiraceae bacterium]